MPSSTGTLWSEEAKRSRLQLPLLRQHDPQQSLTSQTSEQSQSKRLDYQRIKEKWQNEKSKVSVLPSAWSS